jgi:hypothetical protein
VNEVRVVRPDRPGLRGSAREPERGRHSDRGRPRGATCRRKGAVRADEEPPDPDCRQERERRRELEVVVRVEVAAAENAEKRGSKPEPR